MANIFALVFLATFAVAILSCPADKDFHWSSCSDSPSVILSSMTAAPYPVKKSQTAVMDFVYKITNGINYDKVLLNVKIQWYSSITCSWLPVISLNDVDACGSIIQTCPFTAGGADQTNSIHISPDILKVLISGTYYQLTANVLDSNKKEIFCVKLNFLLQA